MERRLATGPSPTSSRSSGCGRQELVIRTAGGPTPFVYRYEFGSTPTGTLVTLRADVTVGRGPALLGPLAAQAVKRGVDANFKTLRHLLERDA